MRAGIEAGERETPRPGLEMDRLTDDVLRRRSFSRSTLLAGVRKRPEGFPRRDLT